MKHSNRIRDHQLSEFRSMRNSLFMTFAPPIIAVLKEVLRVGHPVFKASGLALHHLGERGRRHLPVPLGRNQDASRGDGQSMSRNWVCLLKPEQDCRLQLSLSGSLSRYITDYWPPLIIFHLLGVYGE